MGNLKQKSILTDNYQLEMKQKLNSLFYQQFIKQFKDSVIIEKQAVIKLKNQNEIHNKSFGDIVLIKIEPSFNIQFKQINNTFNKCSNLVYLRLNLFNLCNTNSDAINLFNSFNKCKSITHFELNFQNPNHFSGCVNDSGTLKLAETLCSLQNIQFLNLAITQFTLGTTVSCLGKAISKLKQLKNLVLDFGLHPHDDLVIEINQSKEHKQGFISCFKEISKCSQLKTIQLCLDYINPFKKIRNIIYKCIKLTYFQYVSYESCMHQSKFF
ncbi:hypothetical protein ABPG72_002612 [Tetrahymena utriculariae]